MSAPVTKRQRFRVSLDEGEPGYDLACEMAIERLPKGGLKIVHSATREPHPLATGRRFTADCDDWRAGIDNLKAAATRGAP